MLEFYHRQLEFVSNAGDKTFVAPIIWATTLIFLIATKSKREAFFLILSYLSALFSFILKNIFREKRPETAIVNTRMDQYSFPSSHTLIYTVVFGFIIYLAFKMPQIWLPLRVIAIVTSVYFIALVGASRVYMGEHYSWDVIAGYLFGIVYLITIIALEKNI